MESAQTRGKSIIRACTAALLMTACKTTPPAPAAAVQPLDAFSRVDPFIGTGGHGHTFPGATVPFGFAQPGPDSRVEGWDGCSGYHASDSTLFGFSCTHLSGTGIGDYCDLLFVPLRPADAFADRLNSQELEKAGRGLPFDRSSEQAEPGYYRVKLQNGITAEMTATPHVAVFRFDSGTEGMHLLLNLRHRDILLDASLRQENDRTWTGKRRSKGWASDQHLYYRIVFSQAPAETRSAPADKTAFPDHLDFVFGQGAPLTVQVALSGVDTAGARRNLEAETGGRDFDALRAEARKAWEQELGRIQVTDEENSTNARIFYSALYHTCIQPNLWSDTDGRYRGRDGQIHQDTQHKRYTVFSLWDTFRAAHPLYTLVQQGRTADFMQTFLAQAQEGGRLPVWELSANETNCMIGYHAVSAYVDAWMKGLGRDTDARAALAAMVAGSADTQFGAHWMQAQGYVPAEKISESVSRTLEYAYDDWCIAVLADSLGEQETAAQFYRRARNWLNVLDTETGFMRARMNGGWFEPFRPEEVNVNYTEANAWQYSFFVPHEIGPWMERLGAGNLDKGRERLAALLDQLFTADSRTSGREQADITGLIGQYAHGNEPSHHMAYLYVYAGQAWKTQERVREILRTQYHAARDGYAGNEDCGQMSAWYVMSAMGLYSVTPGSDLYILGSPAFPGIRMNLENGKTFTVEAKGLTERAVYVRSATLNGKAITRAWLRHGEIMAGGSLVFEMDTVPHREWGTPPEAKDMGLTGRKYPAVPVIRAPQRTFTQSMEVRIDPMDNPEIQWQMNGGPVQTASAPVTLTLKENTILKAWAKGETAQAVAEYRKIPEGRSVKLEHPFANQYNGGGDQALLDQIQAGTDFRTGGWQGFQGTDLVAVVDLGKAETLRKLGLNCLQDQKSWIFMPKRVTFSRSTDGVNWTDPVMVGHKVSDRDETVQAFTFRAAVNWNTRYIRVVAENYGICPPWHLGAGGKAWIFADEIWIE